MARKSRILVVEDEDAIRTGLIDVLVYHGYVATGVADGHEGLRECLGGNYDLILLDVMLPGLNGFEICEEVRKADPAQPIIMLTAKSTDDDVIEGLRLGADDYVTKPFSVAQLVLRIEAVLRRAGGAGNAARIALGDNTIIDTQNLCAVGGPGQDRFTRREMDVLEYLHANNERPVSREELLSKVWGYRRDLEIETRTVDIHIAKIRRKIEHDPKNPRFLLTIRGAGYRLMSGD